MIKDALTGRIFADILSGSGFEIMKCEGCEEETVKINGNTYTKKRFYDVLDELKKKGFVNVTKRKKK